MILSAACVEDKIDVYFIILIWEIFDMHHKGSRVSLKYTT